jgi:DNA modification methylase
VLDFTAGSFTTGVACAIENRNFIGIEKDSKYCELGRARIERAMGNAVEMPRIVTNEKPMPLFEME